MKILPVGAGLLRADRQTNRRTDVFALRIIANAPKNDYITCMEKKQSIEQKSPKLRNLYSSNKYEGLERTITLVLADKNR